jgi:hypothetical protein
LFVCPRNGSPLISATPNKAKYNGGKQPVSRMAEDGEETKLTGQEKGNGAKLIEAKRLFKKIEGFLLLYPSKKEGRAIQTKRKGQSFNPPADILPLSIISLLGLEFKIKRHRREQKSSVRLTL